VVAAVRSGMDAKTARKYRRLGRLPSEVRMPHSWRTHPDPFADVWTGVVERLALNPGLEALTLFRQLQCEHPGRFPDGQLRTFQRRVKTWRASHGPAKEVFFAQVHTPGRLCASDFTHMTDLRVTINGRPFEHLIGDNTPGHQRPLGLDSGIRMIGAKTAPPTKGKMPAYRFGIVALGRNRDQFAAAAVSSGVSSPR